MVNLSLNNLHGNSGGNKLFDLACGEERIRDKLVCFGKLDKKEGGVLPVFKGDAVKSTATTNGIQHIELSL